MVGLGTSPARLGEPITLPVVVPTIGSRVAERVLDIVPWIKEVDWINAEQVKDNIGLVLASLGVL